MFPAQDAVWVSASIHFKHASSFSSFQNPFKVLKRQGPSRAIKVTDGDITCVLTRRQDVILSQAEPKTKKKKSDGSKITLKKFVFYFPVGSKTQLLSK